MFTTTIGTPLDRWDVFRRYQEFSRRRKYTAETVPRSSPHGRVASVRARRRAARRDGDRRALSNRDNADLYTHLFTHARQRPPTRWTRFSAAERERMAFRSAVKPLRRAVEVHGSENRKRVKGNGEGFEPSVGGPYTGLARKYHSSA